MKISTLNYFIVDALKSIKRNRTISVAAMITVLITFFVFGTFTLLALNFNKSIEDVASKIQIQVYLNEDIKLVDQKEIELKLMENEQVSEVTYESKDEAFLNLKENLGSNAGLLEGYDLTNNPLPSSFIVNLKDPSYADEVTKSVESMTGVEGIGNQQDVINTISKFVNVVQIVGIGLFAVFIGVSVFLIMNTIKLTVYSRRREVGIMKFVGATDWFIRWPFIIEGMVIGLLGAIFSVIGVYFIYRFGVGIIANNILMVSLINPTYVLTMLSWQFALGGIAVGGVASYIALRKFLVV